MPLTSGYTKLLLASFLIILTATVSVAQLDSHDNWSSSADLSDMLHTESVIIENLRSYVEAYEAKVNAMQRKTEQIREVYEKSKAVGGANHFENPLNAFPLIKRMGYDWEALRNLAWLDVTIHIIKNITMYSEYLTFPKDQELDEAMSKLLAIQDVYQMDSTQVAMGMFNGMKFGGEMSWSDCLILAQQSVKQQKHPLAKVWLKTAMEKLSSMAGSTPKDKAKIVILETTLNAEFRSDNLQEAARVAEEILKLDPNNKRATTVSSILKDKLSRTSNKSKKPRAKKSKEELPAEKICRSVVEQYPVSSTRLRCSVALGHPHPLLYARHVQLETISLEPLILIHHNVLTNKEIEDIRDILNADDDKRKLLAKYSDHLYRITGVKVDSFKDWVSIRSHFYDEIDFRLDAVTTDDDAGSGVLWIQLNEPKLGGAIAFPQLGVKLNLPKGSVLYWSVVDGQNQVEYSATQFTCPIIAGTLEAERILV